MKYVLLALLGALLGVFVAWVAMPGATRIDDAWKYAWLAGGTGCVGGLLIAKKMGRRTRAPSSR